MNDYAERVARGVAILDEIEPGWRSEIDAATLDIAKSEYCIIGQLFGWSDGVELLEYRLGVAFEREWSARHGFDITMDEDCDFTVNHYAFLTDAWLAVLDA
jgi:hypothetical protein